MSRTVGRKWIQDQAVRWLIVAGRAVIIGILLALILYSLVVTVNQPAPNILHPTMRVQPCPNATNRVKEVCKYKRLTDVFITSREYYNRLLVDDRHQVMYCAIPKAACTTFKSLMVSATGLVNKTEAERTPVHSKKALRRLGLQYLSRYQPEEIAFRLSHYRKFVVVRHPWDRLASAYYDKFVDGSLYPNIFRDTIKRVFKSQVQYDSEDIPRLTFTQFLSLIVREHHMNFWNVHWKTFFDLCHPCNINYDAILKLENIGRGLGTVKTWLDYEEDLFHMNTRDAPSENKLVNTTKLFRQFPKTLIEELYKVYQRDFDLFGYQWSYNNGATCEHYTETGQCC